MEQEATYNQAFLQVLQEKEEVLHQLLEETTLQARCFDSDSLDEVRFERIQKRKDEGIVRIEQLNAKFEFLCQEHAKQLEQWIHESGEGAEKLSILSGRLSELVEQIKQAEQQVRERMEQYLIRERKVVKQKREQRKQAANYYKTMTKQYDSMSYFYDQSK